MGRLVDRVEREDHKVLINCNGGKGRSALVAAAVLIGLGVSQSAAVAGVRAARAGSLRNPLQLWFLRSFARRWKSASKKSSELPNPSDMFLSKRASDSYARCLASNTSKK